MQKQSETLVIAEGNYPSTVDHLSYSDLEDKDCPNLAEYENVVINIADLDRENVRHLKESKAISLRRITKFIWGDEENELFLITDGELNKYYTDATKYNLQTLFPVKLFLTEAESGHTIKAEEEYEEYHKLVDKWHFHKRRSSRLVDDSLKIVYESPDFQLMDSAFCVDDPIARNGFGEAISWSVRTVVSYENRKDTSGNITVLQSPRNINQGVNRLLEKIGIHLVSKEPEWARKIVAPEEEEVRKNLQKLEEEKESIIEQISDTEQELEEKTKFKKLLYTKGDELRDIVWETLDELGFDVKKYDNGNEDGAIEVNDEPILLEVKGRENRNAKTDDIRELDDHMSRYLHDKNREPSGLLVVNHQLSKKPSERPEAFQGDVEQAIKKNSRDIYTITGNELFDLFCRFKTDELSFEEVRSELLER